MRRIGLLALMALVVACSPAPVPSPSSPAATPTPVVALTPVPAGGSPAPATEPPSTVGSLQVPMADRIMELTIVGDPSVLTGWRAATEGEVAQVDFGDRDIGVEHLSDHELVLAWIGTICDVDGTLEVGATRLVVSHPPRQGCDAMAIGRGVVLTYAEDIPLAISIEQLPTVLLPE